MAALQGCGETATQEWDALQGINRIDLPPGLPAIICANETPFAAPVYQREPGLLVYTQATPTRR